MVTGEPQEPTTLSEGLAEGGGNRAVNPRSALSQWFPPEAMLRQRVCTEPLPGPVGGPGSGGVVLVGGATRDEETSAPAPVSSALRGTCVFPVTVPTCCEACVVCVLAASASCCGRFETLTCSCTAAELLEKAQERCLVIR